MVRQWYSDAFHASLIFLVFVEGRGKDEWKSYQSSSYLFVNQTKNYTEAQTYCKQRLSNLVSITSEMENDFIVNLTKTSLKWEKNDYIWFGATDTTTEGSFVWENGDPWIKTLHLWSDGEPNNINNQDCLGTRPTTSRWHDLMCHVSFRFICEKSTKTYVSTCSNACVSMRRKSDQSLDESIRLAKERLKFLKRKLKCNDLV